MKRLLFAVALSLLFAVTLFAQTAAPVAEGSAPARVENRKSERREHRRHRRRVARRRHHRRHDA